MVLWLLTLSGNLYYHIHFIIMILYHDSSITFFTNVRNISFFITLTMI